jgi:hypothetical protein
VPLALSTITDEKKLNQLRTNILTLAYHNSAEIIADEVIALAEQYRAKKKD